MGFFLVVEGGTQKAETQRICPSSGMYEFSSYRRNQLISHIFKLSNKNNLHLSAYSASLSIKLSLSLLHLALNSSFVLLNALTMNPLPNYVVPVNKYDFED